MLPPVQLSVFFRKYCILFTVLAYPPRVVQALSRLSYIVLFDMGHIQLLAKASISEGGDICGWRRDDTSDLNLVSAVRNNLMLVDWSNVYQCK